MDVPSHAGAPEGCRCADCSIGDEACPQCYRVWWERRHPSIRHLVGDATPVVALWMADHGYATGHGDTVEDMLVELEGQAKERGGQEQAGEIKRLRAFAHPDPSIKGSGLIKWRHWQISCLKAREELAAERARREPLYAPRP